MNQHSPLFSDLSNISYYAWMKLCSHCGKEQAPTWVNLLQVLLLLPSNSQLLFHMLKLLFHMLKLLICCLDLLLQGGGV